MNNETFNQLSIWLYIILALILFYQSWMNIAKRQITKFSMDALVLLYIRTLKGKNALRKARDLLNREPNRLCTLGFFALCSALTFIYIAIDTMAHP